MSADADLNQPDVIMRLTGQGGAELLHGQTTANFNNSCRASIATRLSAIRRGAFWRYQGGHDQRRADSVARSASVMHQLAEHLKPFLMFARASSNRRMADCRLPVD